MASKPTQRTLDYVERAGGIAWVVERFNPHAGPHGIRVDAWGFGDVLAAFPPREDNGLLGHADDCAGGLLVGDGLCTCGRDMAGALLIQACAAGDLAKRRAKILTTPKCAQAAEAWLRAGNHIQVWGWRKYAKPVRRRYWRLKAAAVTLEDLQT